MSVRLLTLPSELRIWIWECVLGGKVFKIGLCDYHIQDENVDEDWPYEPQLHLWIEKMHPIEEGSNQNSITFKFFPNAAQDYKEITCGDYEGCQGTVPPRSTRPPEHFF